MSFSPLDRLERTALSIASKNGAELDLTNSSLSIELQRSITERLTVNDSNIIVVGPSDPSLIQRIAESVGTHGRITVNEPNYSAEKCNVLSSGYGDFRTKAEFINNYLSTNTLSDVDAYQQFEQALSEQRSKEPVIQDNTVDTVFLDDTLNLSSKDKGQEILSETFRVLRRGGKLVLTIVLTDETLNQNKMHLTTKNHYIFFIPQETEILKMLEATGFYGMSIVWRETLPYKVVAGSELRRFVIEAYKGKQGVCLDQGHAVIYKGPWSEVVDDDGHRFPRGERMAVCAKTYEIMTKAPYSEHFIGVLPYLEIPLDQAPLFDCNTPLVREPAVTKGIKSVFDTVGGNYDPSIGCC